MKDRIKRIRKDAGLTQEEFAKRIGTVQNTITGYETGRRNPSGSAFALICDKFDINPEWLRSGKGEPYLKLPENKLIAKAAQLLGEKDPFIEAVIETYSNLTPKNRELWIKTGLDLLHNLSNKIEQKNEE